MAARGICYFYIIDTVISMLSSLLNLVFFADECTALNAPALEGTVIAMSVIGIALYTWGVFAATSKTNGNAAVLLYAHCFFQVLYVLLTVCQLGLFSRSPREKDPALALRCFEECLDDPVGSFFFGRGTTDEAMCRMPPSTTPGQTYPAVIDALFAVYFAYIFWSLMVRAKAGTVDEVAGQVVAMVALPAYQQGVPYNQHGVPMQAIPTAAPVQGHAVQQGVPLRGQVMQQGVPVQAAVNGDAAAPAPYAAGVPNVPVAMAAPIPPPVEPQPPFPVAFAAPVPPPTEPAPPVQPVAASDGPANQNFKGSGL